MFETIKERIKNELKIINNKDIENYVYNCFFDTIDNCLEINDDNVYIKTGDIPAMWLRDSVCQVMQYCNYLDNKDIQVLIYKLLNTLYKLAAIDPYSNSFMKDETTKTRWSKDISNFSHPLIWERKFEIDSLFYVLYLTAVYYSKTKDKNIINDNFNKFIDTVIKTIEIETNHNSKSLYTFIRKRKYNIVIKPANKDDNDSSLCWTGFRASDDLSTLHYNIPENMFLLTSLQNIKPIVNQKTNEKIDTIINKIKFGIEKYGTIKHKVFGDIYVYETNKENKVLLMDDANIPNLLSLPYFKYPFLDNRIYENTRNYILSTYNKYYFKGKEISGIGSPHTGKNMVWPLGLIMEGLTSSNKEEIKDILKTIINTNKCSVHESINKNNSNKYTREHFGWANSLFSELALSNLEILRELYDKSI